jgi:Histidine kinase
MRKYMALVYFFLSFSFIANAQTWEQDMIFARKNVDSVKNELKTAAGEKKVNCYNLLSELYYWIWDDNDKHLDSMYIYANMALEEAKKINYKIGQTYALINKSECVAERMDNNRTNNDKEPAYAEAYKVANEALKIAEELNNNFLIGRVYSRLAGLERTKGIVNKQKTNIQKAIFHFEKMNGSEFSNGYKPRNIPSCQGCKGAEGAISNLHRDLAAIYFQENNSLANDELEISTRYYLMTRKKETLGRFYLQLAEVVSRTSNLETGLIPLKKAIEQFHEFGDALGEFDAHMRVSRNYWNMGDFEKGFSYCKKGIELAKELSKSKPAKENDYRLGEAYYWMSRFYLSAGDFESALSYLKKTEPFYQNANRKVVWATAIGGVYNAMGNIDSASHYLLPFAEKPIESLGSHVGSIEPCRLLISLKEYDKAISLLNQHIKIDKERNNYLGLRGTLTALSKAYLSKNENRAALNAAREALTAIKRTKGNVLLLENYETLSTVFYKLGNSDSAYIYLKLHMALKDSLLKKQYLFKLNNYKSEAEDARRTSQIMLLQKDYLIKEKELQQQILLKEQTEAQLTLLDKNNEIKDQQLLIKDQSLKEQILLKEQQQSQLTLSDKENKLKDERLKQQAFIRNALLAGLLLFILLGVFIFRSISFKRKNEKLAIGKTQSELMQKMSELEMQALRAQMNPHFIFNCLSSINRFILKNESKIASNYLTRFSRLMRMVLNNSQKPLIALDDELEMLELYLEMERLRFKNSFDYGITFLNKLESDNIFIPPLLLQPFCENAIWHGLMHKEGTGRLDIELSMQDNILNCIVTDNGVGREKAEEMKSKTAEKEKSMGLKITTERLALLNRENGLNTFYEIEDMKDKTGNAAGTKVTLKISTKESIVVAA